MTDYSSVINNLNQKLMFKMRKIRVVPNEDLGSEKTIEEYMGLGFGSHYTGDSGEDVNNVRSDRQYVTHRPHGIVPDHIVKGRRQKDEDDDDGDDSLVDLTPEDEIREQDEEVGDIPTDPETAEAPPEDLNPEADMGGDVGDPGMGDMPPTDPNDPGLGDPMAGMPGQEEAKTPNELGRTYEMKKIYARLVSMNEYLADENSPNILKTKQAIAKSIDLFAVIGANPESYKEKIDEIIISYYKFLEAAYRRVKAFYRSEALKRGTLPSEINTEQNNEDNDTEGI